MISSTNLNPPFLATSRWSRYKTRFVHRALNCGRITTVNVPMETVLTPLHQSHLSILTCLVGNRKKREETKFAQCVLGSGSPYLVVCHWWLACHNIISYVCLTVCVTNEYIFLVGYNFRSSPDHYNHCDCVNKNNSNVYNIYNAN